MIPFLDLIFYLGLALLLIHEIDAIRCQEWRMMVILKNMENKKAYQIFTLFHIPVLILIFWFLGQPNMVVRFWFQIIVDSFLIIHKLLHLLFRNHKENSFTSGFSKGIINGMAIVGLVHLVLILFFKIFF